MANWADLQRDLLTLVANRIGTLEDFAAFGGVCRSWRSAAVKQNFKSSQQCPWLMLAEEDNSRPDERRFVSLTKSNMIGKVTLSEARGKRCLESLGWLITIAQDGEMNLLNPLSAVQIALPHMNTFKYYFEGNMLSNFVTVQKAVLSSSPSKSKDYVLMVIYEGIGYLGFWRAGDKTWTTIEPHVGTICDLISYQGKFYGVDTRGLIHGCDVGGSNPTVSPSIGGIPNEFLDFKRPYIVELDGAILIVVRDGCDPEFLDDEEDEDEADGVDDYSYPRDTSYIDNLDESRVRYGTREFRVFKVDLSTRRWAELQSLGDNALFLGVNSSISVKASKFTGIKPNCIYYTDDCWEAYKFFKRGGGKDMGIYNLEDRNLTPCYQGESFSGICPPLWVTPSM